MFSSLLGRFVPLMVRNLMTNNRNPEALEQQRDQRAANARPVGQGGQSKPPKLHETGELKEKFAREFADRGLVAKYAGGPHGRWEESKHPRASDGRFGTKPGEHGGADEAATAKGKGQEAPQATPAEAPKQSPTKDGSQADEPTTPPPPGGYSPDPNKVNPQTGYTDAARVGVPGMSTPPPPSRIPRLPNLTPDERKAEENFAKAFEADPDGMAADFMNQVMNGGISDGPNVFATDDAKLLSGDWNQKGAPPEQQMAAKALYNTAVHQTANAIAKRAFLKYLDEVVSQLPEDRKSVLVTAGGVASGKGYAIGQVGQVNSISQAAGAVWDTAGEQNSTELPWVRQECQKRGIPMVVAYIHAMPQTTFPRAVSRANQKGRMVDARVYADSYQIGAQNFAKFQQDSAGDPNVQTFVIDNETPWPKEGLQDTVQRVMDRVPDAAIKLDTEKTYQWALNYLNETPDIKPEIKRAGTAGTRIWADAKAPAAQPSKPGVAGQQMGLFGGTSPGGQQSLFNMQKPTGVPAKKPAPSPLSGASASQRKMLAGKPTVSQADLSVKPQSPSKPGQKSLFSRNRSGLTAQFADAFARIGLG